MSLLVVEKLCVVVCIMKGKVTGVTSAATSVSSNSFISSDPVYSAALSIAVYLFLMLGLVKKNKIKIKVKNVLIFN